MEISYLEFGEKGKPIVFLHGWQQDKKSFSPLIPYLYKDFHLYLLDLPGFGQSKLPASIFSSQNYAKTIIKWLTEQKLTQVVIVGHSFGGKIASIVASENPKIISKLILIANSGFSHPKKWYPFLKIIPQPIKTFFSPISKHFLASRDYKEAGNLLPFFKNTVKEDLTATFQKIKSRTLIIWGKKDQELPAEDGEKINKLIPNSQLIFVDSGHLSFQENPKEIAKIICDFIRK